MAVDPAEELRVALRALPRPERPGLRWTTEDQWHVTLWFSASVDPAALVAAMERGFRFGSSATARAGPAPMALSRHVWVLPVAGLDSLEAAVSAALGDLAPQESTGRPFAGHLTLARRRDRRGFTGLEQPPLGCSWPVGEVVAYRSHLLPSGARYEALGRWKVPTG